MRSFRSELRRAQLRPLLALACFVAILTGLLVLGQYLWVRHTSQNPLDELRLDEIHSVMHDATPEQVTVLTRWIAQFGLLAVPVANSNPQQVQLASGEQVPLSVMVRVVANGQPLPLQPADWGVRSVPLSDGRTLVIASPSWSLSKTHLAQVLLAGAVIAFASTLTIVGGFMLLLGRRWSDATARDLSDSVETLSDAVHNVMSGQMPTLPKLKTGVQEINQLGHDFSVLQQHLRDALVEMHRRADAERRLVAEIAHELRTPLTVIHGHAEMLGRGQPDPDAAHIILLQVTELHTHLSDLLDTARLTDITAAMDLQPIRVDGLPAEMLARFGAAARRREITLNVCAVSTEPLYAIADARWLRQVITNLLSNALRHTPPGGVIQIGCAQKDAGPEALPMVGLTVYNSCAGWGHLPPMTDSDGAIDNPPSRLAGVGMALASRLLDAMGGQLQIDTHIDHGVQVEVYLRHAGIAAN